MKNLYVHIGFPRTATKTLQFNLFKRHKDINYIGRFPNRYLSHNNIIFKIFEFSDQQFKKNFKELSDEFKNLPLSSSKPNVLSDEFFLLNHILHQNIHIKDSIHRLNELCKSNYINLKIIYSVRNQLDAISSLIPLTFLSSLRTNCDKIILTLNETSPDKYTTHFLNGYNYNFLHETLLKIVGTDNLNVIFYEKLIDFKEEYSDDISKILNISSPETLNLLNKPRIHKRFDQIMTKSNLSSKSQLVYFQLKKLRLHKIFKKDFVYKSIIFFKKKILYNNFDKKEISLNRENLKKFMINLTKNRKLVKNYFLESNKEFFKINNTHKSIKKFYL